MKIATPDLLTPIYLKLSAEMPWPENESIFYLATADGLFRCRNHPFFRSSVRVEDGPPELAGHAPSLELHYPKLPQQSFEQVIGFFGRIAERYGAEAAVLLAWDQLAKTVNVIVPPQCGLVGRDWYGRTFPVSLHYEVPELPPHLLLIGDIHSHVDEPAFASTADKEDERHRPGLHLVVGRIQHEPPDFHCEVMVDGSRFRVPEWSALAAGYEQRRPQEVPVEWYNQFWVKTWGQTSQPVSEHAHGM